MLYLMMNKTDKTYLVKVGYSDGTRNLSNRRKQYFSYNPTAIMKSSCAGPSCSENTCHAMLAEMGGQRIKGTEWFYVSEALFNDLYKQGMGLFKPNQKPIHFIEEFENGA